MSEILEWAGKYAVVQSALAALVLIYGWQKIIRKGEKEPSTEEDMKARWKVQQEISDIAENVKTIATYQREIKQAIERLVSVTWNDKQ